MFIDEWLYNQMEGETQTERERGKRGGDETGDVNQMEGARERERE